MKWVGAILLICATTLIGFELAKRLSNRPKEIRQLKSALHILEAEIVYSQAPLALAFDKIANQLAEPVSELFYSVATELQTASDLTQTWNNQVDQFLKRSSLGPDEEEVLKQFGKTLGQHDITQQKKYIKLALTHLDRVLTEAQENNLRYGKMFKNLGILAGLFLVLLLI